MGLVVGVVDIPDHDEDSDQHFDGVEGGNLGNMADDAEDESC
jgi:hypothetical protein